MSKDKKIALLEYQECHHALCRICEQNILLKFFKDHSVFCKKIDDLEKKIDVNTQLINEYTYQLF